MRFGTNKTIENFQEINCFQVEYSKNPRKEHIQRIASLPSRTLNVGVNYSQANNRIYFVIISTRVHESVCVWSEVSRVYCLHQHVTGHFRVFPVYQLH